MIHRDGDPGQRRDAARQAREPRAELQRTRPALQISYNADDAVTLVVHATDASTAILGPDPAAFERRNS